MGRDSRRIDSYLRPLTLDSGLSPRSVTLGRISGISAASFRSSSASVASTGLFQAGSSSDTVRRRPVQRSRLDLARERLADDAAPADLEPGEGVVSPRHPAQEAVGRGVERGEGALRLGHFASSSASFGRHRPQGLLSGQDAADVLDDHARHLAPRLDGGAAGVRHQDDAVVVEQRRRDRRARSRRRRAPAPASGPASRARVRATSSTIAPARRVQQQAARLHLRERLGVEETPRLVGQRHVDRDDVGAPEQLVERDARRIVGIALVARRTAEGDDASCRRPSPGGRRPSRCGRARRRRRPCP